MLDAEVASRPHLFQDWERDNLSAFPPSPGQHPDGAIDVTQRKILDYVSQHPGVHLRQICRELDLGMGNVQYHLYRLERTGKISSARRGFYRFYYLSALFGEKQRDVLSMLSLSTPREMLLHLINKPSSSQDELARGLGLSQPTVSWHLKRLVDLGIVEKQQVGRNATYRVIGGSAREIASLIRSYHPTVWERWSSSLADIFISYNKEEGGDKEKR